jgi:hypothetical protein
MKKIPVLCCYDEMRDVVSLIHHPKNPNKHPQEQIEMLARIIQYQGWRNPILVSKRSGFIVAGHGRLDAAKYLKAKTVPVDFQEFKTEADELAHLAADNRLAELAERDEQELAALLREIDEAGLDLDLAGYESLIEEDEENEEVEPEMVFSEILDESSNYLVMKFSSDIDWLQAQTHFNLSTVMNKRSNGKPWSSGIGRVIDGAEYLERMQKEAGNV